MTSLGQTDFAQQFCVFIQADCLHCRPVLITFEPYFKSIEALKKLSKRLRDFIGSDIDKL